MLLRARQILPLTAPPIEDGAVFVSGARFHAVGRWDDLRRGHIGPALDLGDVLLAPGFVNGHCHLDYTHMAGRFPPPERFTDWIRALLAAKAASHPTEHAAAWRLGAEQLLRSGTTTVANIESIPEIVAAARSSTPLRVISFLELTGVLAGEPADAIVARAQQQLEALAGNAPDSVGLSPHAPYSTLPQLLTTAATCARNHGWRLTTHLAESQDEFEMFTRRSGPLFDWLASRRPMEDCGLGSPVEHADRCHLLGPDLLAVHANEVTESDIALLSHRATAVVHCPRSHAYFGHRPFPRAMLEHAGVNVCLGTDSLASAPAAPDSTPTLSMSAELGALLKADPALAPETALAMATYRAAQALGFAGLLGELRPGASADLLVIPATGSLRDAASAVVHHPGWVAATMVRGQWAWASPEYLRLA